MLHQQVAKGRQRYIKAVGPVLVECSQLLSITAMTTAFLVGSKSILKRHNIRPWGSFIHRYMDQMFMCCSGGAMLLTVKDAVRSQVLKSMTPGGISKLRYGMGKGQGAW